MFYSLYGAYLKSKLKTLLPKDYLITDDTMLRAYTEFWMAKNGYKKNQDKPDFLNVLDDTDSRYYHEVMEEFLGLEYFGFLRFVIPCYILNPESLRIKFLRLNKGKDIVDITITILLIKKITREQIFKNLSKRREDILYENYEKNIQTEKIGYKLGTNDFRGVVLDVISFPMDIQDVILSSHCHLRKNVFDITSIFNDELKETKNKQLEYCARIHSKGINKNSIEILQPANFCQLSHKDWLKKMHIIYEKILALDPLDILCGIYISKKSSADFGTGLENNKKMLASNFVPNDIVTENTIVYELFRSNFPAGYREGNNCIIIFPTPFFVKKWAEDELLNDLLVTFVVENIWYKKLYEEHFGTVDYCGIIRDNINFITYEELQQVDLHAKEFKYTNALLFVNNIKDNIIRHDIFRVLEKNSPILKSVYCLSSDYYLQDLLRC